MKHRSPLARMLWIFQCCQGKANFKGKSLIWNSFGDVAENDNWVFVVGRERAHLGTAISTLMMMSLMCSKAQYGQCQCLSQKSVVHQDYYVSVIIIEIAVKIFVHSFPSSLVLLSWISYKISILFSCRPGPGYFALQRWQRLCERFLSPFCIKVLNFDNFFNSLHPKWARNLDKVIYSMSITLSYTY